MFIRILIQLDFALDFVKPRFMRGIFSIYILIVTLVLFLQGCSSRETQPKVPTVPGRASGNNGASDKVDSQKASQEVQGYFEKDACQFVQKGSHLAGMLMDTIIEPTEIIEIIEGIPKEVRDLRLYQRKFPVEFYIDSNMPEKLIEPINEVFSDWNREAGFEVFTNKGIYDSQGIITSKSQIDESDQKNVIYWVMPTDQSIFGGTVGVVSCVLPSLINSIDESNRLPFDETNVFMNGLIFPDSQLSKKNREKTMELFDIVMPSNYQTDFEVFTSTNKLLVAEVQNVTDAEFREIAIELFEFQKQHNILDDDIYSQLLANVESPSAEYFNNIRLIVISVIEQGSTRFNFELLADNGENFIIYFKNVLKHEMGHTLGLANLFKDDIDVTDQTQIPLMWYNIAEGMDPNNPASYFDNLLDIDRYTLHALSCNYDLEALRNQAQQP